MERIAGGFCYKWVDKAMHELAYSSRSLMQLWYNVIVRLLPMQLREQP